jgi:diguanylate cyclase (GGDEF)-like protein/PAS domain S-box-containing protein
VGPPRLRIAADAFGSYILDITEQKRAEEELRASEERYRAVVEDQSEYIRRLDPDRILTFANGKSREELLGADYLSLLPAASAEIVRRHLDSLRPEHPTVSYELAVTLADGTPGWEEWTDRAIFDAHGRLVEYQSVGRDVTERKRADAHLFHLAHHDPLTDLPNQLLLQDRLGQALARARRESSRVAFMMLDLDNFKTINDRFGHPAGDRLLRAVAHRLRRLVRDSDTVARIGGDEFAILQTGRGDARGAAVLAEKVIAALAKPFLIGRWRAQTFASIGIALYPDHGKNVERWSGTPISPCIRQRRKVAAATASSLRAATIRMTGRIGSSVSCAWP